MARAIAGLKLAVVFGFCMLIHHCQATQYTVGGTVGWALSTLNYSQWAAQNTYKVGDTLLFVYSATDHTVLEVNKADYDSCSTSSPLKTYMGGKNVVSLSKAGNQWFICGTIGHCPTMAFGITVTAVTAASPPTSTGSSPPKTAPAPSPTKSTPPKTAPTPSPSTIGSPPPNSSPTASPPSVSAPPAPPTGVSPSNNTPPPPSPSPSGSSALAAKSRGNAYMVLLGMVALVFCSVLHPF